MKLQDLARKILREDTWGNNPSAGGSMTVDAQPFTGREPFTPYRRDMWTDRGRGPSRWTDEHANSKPIAWETKQIFSINGEEYAVVVMYADCKVYWTSATDNRTQIISASFTGYSPKQNILYVKDIRKRNLIGGIGLVLRTIDLNVPLQTVDEYNRSLFGAERVFPPPIKDKELDDMFEIGKNI